MGFRNGSEGALLNKVRVLRLHAHAMLEKGQFAATHELLKKAVSSSRIIIQLLQV